MVKKEQLKIIYAALDIISEKNKADPLSMMEKALQNVGPSVEVNPEELVFNYQVPIEVNPRRKLSLAMRWILDAAQSRNEKSMKNKLASEYSMHVKAALPKEEDVHKMAEANVLYYRW